MQPHREIPTPGDVMTTSGTLDGLDLYRTNFETMRPPRTPRPRNEAAAENRASMQPHREIPTPVDVMTPHREIPTPGDVMTTSGALVNGLDLYRTNFETHVAAENAATSQ